MSHIRYVICSLHKQVHQLYSLFLDDFCTFIVSKSFGCDLVLYVDFKVFIASFNDHLFHRAIFFLGSLIVTKEYRIFYKTVDHLKFFC